MTATGAGEHLAANILGFARGLRRAGLPVGTGRALEAVRAAQLLDLSQRDELYWGLASVLIDRQAHLEIFDAAFRYFWEQQTLSAQTATPSDDPVAESRELAQRVAQAFAPSGSRDSPVRPSRSDTSSDATHTASLQEQLGRMDFQSMSLEQMREAQRMLAQLRLPMPPLRTRRFRPDERGPRVDLRSTLRASLRGQSELLPLSRVAPRYRQPPLVVLCDISGSMHRYAQMLMHFLHAVTGCRERMHVFLFGTRLTNVTRALRHRDVDVALAALSRTVTDWGGGTRIGASLRTFNQQWSRRVLGQNAVVLLITDGLERDEVEVLGRSMERLHKSSARLIWLNPLLRYEKFQPVALGVRTMLPHVDEFRAAHNVRSLMELGKALSGNALP